MNLSKVTLRAITKHYSIRTFSALSRTKYVTPFIDERLYELYKFPLKNCERSLSLQGFVEWQQETYNSICNSYPVGVMQDSLLYIHDVSGLPWWATIATSTLFLRGCMTLPLTIYQNYILAKVENIGLELRELLDELKMETAMAKKIYNLSDKQAIHLFKRSMKKQYTNLIVRDNCHPFKASLVIWLQIPIWVCTSFALRNLVQVESQFDAAAMITFTELTVGGFGWIPNLTVPDHSLVLPIVFGLSNLAIIEVQKMSRVRPPSKVYNFFTNVFRIFSIVMIPIAASVPSCMCLYWTVSTTFGLVQNLTLLSPPVRRKLKIPITPSELEYPYQHMAGVLKERVNKITPSFMK